MATIEYLEATRLFGGLETAQLIDISSMCTLRDLLPGDVIIAENQRGQTDLFVLCSGNVEVLSKHIGTLGGEVVLSNKDAEVFGEVSWLLGEMRTATVRCVDEVVVLQIDGPTLRAYFVAHPAAGYAVMTALACMLARRIKNTDILLKQLLWNSLI